MRVLRRQRQSVTADRRDGEQGVILVAVIMSIVAAAGIVAALYGAATMAGRTAGGGERLASVDEFAKGSANLCTLVVDAVLSVGDFSPPNTFTAGSLKTDGGYTVSWDAGNQQKSLYEELVLADNLYSQISVGSSGDIPDWGSDNGLPDVQISNGRYKAKMDVDLLLRTQPAGEGVEFGEAVQGQQKTLTLNTYRCTVEAEDENASERKSRAYAYIRKPIGGN